MNSQIGAVHNVLQLLVETVQETFIHPLNRKNGNMKYILNDVRVKNVKLKFTPQQVTNAQRGSRGIAVPLP